MPRRLLILIAALAMLLSGCLPAGEVAIVGDSISYESRDEIVAAIPQATVHAYWGRSFADPVRDFNDQKVVVVELGTNDIWQHRPLEQVLADAEKLFASEGCVVYVNTTEQSAEPRNMFLPVNYDNAAAAELNDALEPRADVVVDWNTASNSTTGALEDDTIHPTARGQRLLARLIAKAVDQC